MIPKKTLIIVGNAPRYRRFLRYFKIPLKNHTDFINAADEVIRFNECPNFDKKTGTKTTVLALVNNGSPARKFYTTHCLPPQVVAQAHTVWFSRPMPQHYDYLLRTDIADNVDLSLKIIDFQQLHHKKVAYTDEYLFEKLHKKLIAQSDNYYKPSSGMAVVETVVHSSDFDDYNKYLIGFTWHGWHGHSWQAEKNLCMMYERQGLIKILK